MGVPIALSIAALLAQAEPAPPAPVPAPASVRPRPSEPPLEAPEPPATAVGFAAGVGYRLAPAARDVPPALGLSLTTLIGRRYALLRGQLALGVAASFAYERYSTLVKVTKEVMPGREVPYEAVRGISFFDFAVLQTAAVELGRLRPWAAVGAGASLGHFTSPEPRYGPGEARVLAAVLLGGLGLDVAIAKQTDVGLRLEYAHLVPRPELRTDGGERLDVFGHRLAARLSLQYRF